MERLHFPPIWDVNAVHLGNGFLHKITALIQHPIYSFKSQLPADIFW